MTAHLDTRTWNAFLEGRLDDDTRRALAAHLEGGCETCEAFLAEAAARGEVDYLDGPVDDALFALVPEAPVRDDLGFERIRRKVQRRRLPRVATGVIGAIAAAAALVLLVRTAGAPVPGTERLKGPVTAPQTRLEVYRAGTPGTAPVPVAPGDTVAAGSTLVFRVHLDGPGCVQLWRRSARPEALLPTPVCLSAGSHVLERRGTTLGLPVTSPGNLELWLVPEARGLTPSTVRRHVARGAALPGADHVGLHVAPAKTPEVR